MNVALLLICLWILPFVDQPWLVAAPIALFGACGIWGRNAVACIAAGAWLAYGGCVRRSKADSHHGPHR
jgi:hypothetical protein